MIEMFGSQASVEWLLFVLLVSPWVMVAALRIHAQLGILLIAGFDIFVVWALWPSFVWIPAALTGLYLLRIIVDIFRKEEKEDAKGVPE